MPNEESMAVRAVWEKRAIGLLAESAIKACHSPDRPNFGSWKIPEAKSHMVRRVKHLVERDLQALDSASPQRRGHVFKPQDKVTVSPEMASHLNFANR